MVKKKLKLRKQNVDLISITPVLIGLVRQRPLLWDTTRADFYDLPQRAELWREVAREIFSSDEINAEETEYMSQLIKLRWRNVRTSYVRYLKRGAETKPEYIYESEMSFYTSQSRSTYDTFNPSFENSPRKFAKHRKSSTGKQTGLESKQDLNNTVKTRSQKLKAEKRRKLVKEEIQEDDLNEDHDLNNGGEPEEDFDDDQCFFDSLKPALRELTPSERKFFQTNVLYKLSQVHQS